MHAPILVALAAAALYAHGSCVLAPSSIGDGPIHGTRASIRTTRPAITLAAARVGTSPRPPTTGGHCLLAALPASAPLRVRTVAARDTTDAALATHEMPTPWGCYTLTVPVTGDTANGELPKTACAAFPTVDVLSENNPFS
jgi:hypothetical protein